MAESVLVIGSRFGIGVLVALVCVSHAIARGKGKDLDSAGFAGQKTQMLERISEREKRIAGHKQCVSAAQSQESLKACREKMQEDMAEVRAERIDNRIERLEKRKESLQR